MPKKTEVPVRPKSAPEKPASERFPFGKDATVTELRSNGCNVTYEKSLTKNLGNYESAKITVAVTLPIDPTPDEVAVVKKTLEMADAIVTDELELQVKELVEAK
jgi:hypothetical protein